MIKIIHLDELIEKCGHFTTSTTVNNAYGCTHPEQEESDIDINTNKPHGKCYSFSCPLGHEADLEDMKELDQELYDEWKNEDHDPTFMGADYMVIDISTLEAE